MKLLLALVGSLMLVRLACADPVVLGEGADRISRQDIADVEALAAQILPGWKVAVIRTMIPNGATGVREVRGLNVYAEPSEQTPRLWRGFYFVAVLKGSEHPAKPGLPQAGRWLDDETPSPARHYGVIAPADKTLPAFSVNALQLFSPIQLGPTTSSEEAVTLHDFIKQIPPAIMTLSGEQRTVELATLEISTMFIMNTPSVASVGLRSGPYGGASFHLSLRKVNSQWVLDKVRKPFS
jgi:hypothetical protein